MSERLDERFADWVDGRLSPAERAALEAEMARDPALRQAAEEYRQGVQLVRAALAPEDMGESLAAGVLARIRQDARPPRARRPLLASLVAAAALVTVFVVLRAIPPAVGPSRQDVATGRGADADLPRLQEPGVAAGEAADGPKIDDLRDVLRFEQDAAPGEPRGAPGAEVELQAARRTAPGDPERARLQGGADARSGFKLGAPGAGEASQDDLAKSKVAGAGRGKDASSTPVPEERRAAQREGAAGYAKAVDEGEKAGQVSPPAEEKAASKERHLDALPTGVNKDQGEAAGAAGADVLVVEVSPSVAPRVWEEIDRRTAGPDASVAELLALLAPPLEGFAREPTPDFREMPLRRLASTELSAAAAGERDLRPLGEAVAAREDEAERKKASEAGPDSFRLVPTDRVFRVAGSPRQVEALAGALRARVLGRAYGARLEPEPARPGAGGGAGTGAVAPAGSEPQQRDTVAVRQQPSAAAPPRGRAGGDRGATGPPVPSAPASTPRVPPVQPPTDKARDPNEGRGGGDTKVEVLLVLRSATTPGK